jgi:hypothetical protein
MGGGTAQEDHVIEQQEAEEEEIQELLGIFTRKNK